MNDKTTPNNDGKANLRIVKRSPTAKNDRETAAAMANPDMQTPLQERYEIRRDGVYFYAVKTDKDGIASEQEPVKLSDAFKVMGGGADYEGMEYRIIEYKHPYDKSKHLKTLPLAMVGTREAWARLRGWGLGVNANTKRCEALSNFIQWHGDKTRYALPHRTGWLEASSKDGKSRTLDFGAFVLPDGGIIGKAENTLYIGDDSKADAYQPRGTLAEWRREVAAHAVGNSRLLTAMGAVFAAPLLAIAGLENGGFHFYGASSAGKSLTGLFASSIVGNPYGLKIQWKGTALSVENEAAANNDGLIFMDEIGQANPHDLKDLAYSLFNGTSKGQARPEQHKNRKRFTWRCCMISTGELTAPALLARHKIEWDAGQEVRLPSIPADAGKGYGVFDTVHGFDDSAALAKHLGDAVRRYHGTAWREYLATLTEKMAANPAQIKKRLAELQDAFNERLPSGLASQKSRVADRFALAAAALELASEWGITGFASGMSTDGVLRCFEAWIEQEGTGNREETTILDNAKTLLERDGLGERFFNLNAVKNPPIPDKIETKRDFAGFIEPATLSVPPVWYFTDEVFHNEICKGYSPKDAVAVLRQAGWLLAESGRDKTRLPHSAKTALKDSRRFYALRGSRPPAEIEADNKDDD